MNKLEEMTDTAIRWARLCIERDQEEPLPCFYAENAKGESAIIGTPFEDDEDKNKIVSMLKMMFLWKKVVAYSYCGVAWAATYEDEDGYKERPPSRRNDRKEVVIILSKTRKGSSFTMAEILRSDDNVMSLGEPETDSTSIGGRFDNLLPPAHVRQIPIPDSVADKFREQWGGRDTMAGVGSPMSALH